MDGTPSSYAGFRDSGITTWAAYLANKAIHQVVLMLAILPMLTNVPAQAQFLTGTVPTGSGPIAIGINAVTNKVYVANAADGTLTVIDGATGRSATIAVGPNPQAVLVNSVTNKIYVANSNASGTVTVVDGATNRTTTVVVGGYPSALALDAAANSIYVANEVASGTLTVIDGSSDSVVATLAVGGSPSGVAVDPTTHRIFVANRGTDTVTVVNGADNSTSSISTGARSNPVAIAVNSATGRVYVACGNGSLAVIDENTRLVSTVSVAAGVWTLALDPASGMVYALSKNSNQLVVIDGATNTVARTVAVGASPVAVGVNSAAHQVYTANSGDGSVTIIDGATFATTTLTVGGSPGALGVDPVTNKVYVVHEDRSMVSVIDGSTNTLAKVSVGSAPTAIAAYPMANKIYAGSASGSSVTVIDGITNATTEVATGNSPQAFASNPLTNQVYVANLNDQTVTVIDGASNATTTINLGASPRGIAVNPATNRVYVSTTNSNTLTVLDGITGAVVAAIPLAVAPAMVAVNPATNMIYAASPSGNSLVVLDGATNAITSVAVGNSPRGLAVSANRVYVVNEGDNTVTVIDGFTATVVATVAVGNGPHAVAANPITNRVYVANQTDSTVSVIDGLTNTASTVALGNLRAPADLAVNAASNKIYVAGHSTSTLAIIDGITNAVTIVADANAVEPSAVAVDALTGKVYVANHGSSSVTVLTEQQISASPIEVSVLPLEGNVSPTLAPHWEFARSGRLRTMTLNPGNLMFQVDSWQGPWLRGSALGDARFSGDAPALAPGFHILYAFASDGQSANSASPHAQGSSLDSNIAAYGFTVSPPSAAVSTPSVNFGSQQRHTHGVARSVTLSNQGGGALAVLGITTTGDFSATDTCGSTLAPFANCTIAVTFTPTAAGERQGALTIATGEVAARSALTVSLAGNASSTGPPSFSPSSLTFTAQVAGTKSSSQPVTLTNNTGATLTSISFSLAAAPDFTETDNCGTSLTAGAACTVNVIFAPTLSDTLASLNLGTNGSLQEAIVLSSSYTTSTVGVAVSGTAQAFGFSASATTTTVAAGQTGTFNLSMVPIGGYNQTVALTCTTPAPNTTCSVNPTSAMLDGTHSTPITVSVATQAHSGIAPRAVPPPVVPDVRVGFWWLSLAALLGMALALRRIARLRWLLLPAAFGLILTWSACGGSQANKILTGTPAGSWVVTVTGTSSSLTSTTNLTLNVN